MARKSRLAIAFVACLMFTSGVTAATFAQSAPVKQDPTALSPDGKKAFIDLSACLNRDTSEMNVLYVADVSGSMRATDPGYLRAQILEQSVKELGVLSENLPVRYAFSTFGERYTERIAWTNITQVNVSEESARVRRIVQDTEPREALTDYKLVIQNGQDQIAKAPNAASACQVIVWLSDGGIDLDGTGSSSAQTSDALRELCATNPATGAPARGTSPATTTQLRRAGVTLLGVLLSSDEYLASLSPPEERGERSAQSYMRPIVEGIGEVDPALFGGSTVISDFKCGDYPIPGRQSAGALLIATEPISLAMRFAQLAALTRGGLEAAISTGEPNTFEIESGVARFEVVVPSLQWRLVSPSGVEVATQDGAKSVGVEVSQDDAIARVRVDVARDSVGRWSLFRTQNVLPAQLYLFNGLSIEVAEASLTAIQGQSNQFGAKVEGLFGQPVDLSEFGKFSLSVEAKSADATVERVLSPEITPRGDIAFSYAPPKGVGQFTMVLRLDTALKSGTQFAPVQKEVSVRVQSPKEFPSVEPAVVVMSDLIGRNGEAKGMIELRGSVEAAGQACFGAPVIEQDPEPERITKYQWRGVAESCVEVSPGEVVTLDVSAQNDTSANGPVEGYLPVTLTSQASGTAFESSLGLRFQSVKVGANPLIFFILLALGIAAPLLVAYLVNFLQSRFRTQGLMRADVSVTLSQSGLGSTIARSDGKLPVFLVDDFKYLSPGGGSRMFKPGTEQLRVKLPINPFGEVRAEVAVPQGYWVVSSEHPTVTEKGAVAGMSLNPANTFYFVTPARASNEPSAVDGQLIAYVSQDVQSTAELVAKLDERVRQMNWFASLAPLSVALQAAPGAQSKQNASLPATDTEQGRRDRSQASNVSSRETAEESPFGSRDEAPMGGGVGDSSQTQVPQQRLDEDDDNPFSRPPS